MKPGNINKIFIIAQLQNIPKIYLIVESMDIYKSIPFFLTVLNRIYGLRDIEIQSINKLYL